MDTDSLIAILEDALVKNHNKAEVTSKEELSEDMREAFRDHELGKIVLPILETQPEFSMGQHCGRPRGRSSQRRSEEGTGWPAGSLSPES